MGHVTELHLHLDGSLRPETVWELAKEQGIRLPAESAEEVKYKMEVPEDCRTLEEYLERLANGEIFEDPSGDEKELALYASTGWEQVSGK